MKKVVEGRKEEVKRGREKNRKWKPWQMAARRERESDSSPSNKKKTPLEREGGKIILKELSLTPTQAPLSSLSGSFLCFSRPPQQKGGVPSGRSVALSCSLSDHISPSPVEGERDPHHRILRSVPHLEEEDSLSCNGSQFTYHRRHGCGLIFFRGAPFPTPPPIPCLFKPEHLSPSLPLSFSSSKS